MSIYRKSTKKFVLKNKNLFIFIKQTILRLEFINCTKTYCHIFEQNREKSVNRYRKTIKFFNDEVLKKTKKKISKNFKRTL